jgi:oxamate amidohydrolase
MLNSVRGCRGMVVAPHALAAQAGLAVLREGGNAAEASVAVAAALAVVYPHMTGIGGDAFWLCRAPGEAPRAITGVGRTPADLTAARYREAGHAHMPVRGPWAANTVAGAVSAWGGVLDTARDWGGRMHLERLLADAVHLAREGQPVTASQCRTTVAKREELASQPGFAQAFLDAGEVPAEGSRQRPAALAATLARIAEAGCEDFYRGDLARVLAADLEAAGSPVGLADLQAHRAVTTPALSARFAGARLYNTPPPSQGLASLMILALYERIGGLRVTESGVDHIHLLVEATKRAFAVRDRVIRDPVDMTAPPAAWLAADALDREAAAIDPLRAAPWGAGETGDTTWFGVIDGAGRMVSAIQSLYHEFGSGVVLGRSGICWQNRGTSFTLDRGSPRSLVPGRQPFHTLNPAMAELADGRWLVYGTMGGDGQPQTQAAVFTRIAVHGMSPQAAITAPRWLLGRTWGSHSTSLKLESRFDPAVIAGLRARGHELETVEPYSEIMGHAGALLFDPAGVMTGGADPRSDGLVAAF